MSTHNCVADHPSVVATPQPSYRGPAYANCDHPVRVDFGLHNLLPVLWARGFQTQFACRGSLPNTTRARTFGTRGYITFRKIEDAMEFFAQSHQRAMELGMCCPHIVLETLGGLSEDMAYLDEHLPTRGIIRFEHVDLPALEEIWGLV